MSFVDKVKCFVMGHDFSDWSYEEDKDCRQTRKCGRAGCGLSESRVQHVMGNWKYKSAKSCQKIKSCARCPEIEKGETEHQWGPWTYVAEGSCAQERRCKRCDKAQKGDKKHTWEDWEYVQGDSREVYLTRLRQMRVLLTERFSKQDISTLCYDLHVEEDNLAGETKSDKVIALLKWAEFHHQVPALTTRCAKSRPEIHWKEMGLLEKTEAQNVDMEKFSWEFDQTTSCSQSHVCSRCGQREDRKEHVWNPDLEYKSPDSCIKAKYCRRCGTFEDAQVVHDWDQGKWQDAGKKCKQVLTCRRCGEKKETLQEHEWSGYKYESDASCERVRRCDRCKAKEKGEPKHAWGDWKYESPTSCRQVSMCSRCHEKRRTDKEEHLWSDWIQREPDACEFYRKCEHCSQEGKSVIRHKWGEWEVDARTGRPARECFRCDAAESDLSGIWQGTAQFNQTGHWWDLALKQKEEELSGCLVSVYLKQNTPTVVRQSIKGRVNGREVAFAGADYCFLCQGQASQYYTCSISGSANKDGDALNAEISDAGSKTGNCSLELFETGTVSGIWLGESKEEDPPQTLILCLKQVGSSLYAKMFVYISKGLVFKKNTVVEEEMEGAYEDGIIRLGCTSLDVLVTGDAVNGWLPDNIEARLEGNRKMTAIKFDERQAHTKVTFNLARSLPAR